MDATRYLPVLRWAGDYTRADLRADLLAGFTTAVMLVPQGMGYAMLAGLPPIVGLYASMAPLLAYAVLGTGRQLAVGPVAMDSLLVAMAVGAIAQSGSDAYVAHAVLLAVMVGGIQLLLGLLRMGFVANFLSRPVLSGFTSAAALIIGASQLKHLLAVELPRGHDIVGIAREALAQLDGWHLPTLLLGLANLVGLVMLKRLAPRVPRAMVAVALSAGAVLALGLSDAGVAIVGAVPAGLPALALPPLDLEVARLLLPAAVTIALVAFVETISVGKQFARSGGYEIDPSQELVALGAANLAGGVTGGYPVTAGFSRTAVNAQAGARTPLAGVVTAALVALTLLLLTPLFFHLPKAALSAIIVAAVAGLFDLAEPRRLWRVKRADLGLLVFTFAMTLTLGIQYGILLGAGLSVAMFVVQTTRPHFAVLGEIPGTESYLNVARHPHAITHPGILIVRIDAQFYFGNVSFLKQTLRELQTGMEQPLRALILDASGINQLDSSAEGALREIDSAYREAGVRLLWSHVKGPVRDVMQRSGMLDDLAQQDRIFLRTHEALLAATGARPPRLGAGRDDDPRAPADRIGCGSVVPPPDADAAPATAPSARHPERPKRDPLG